MEMLRRRSHTAKFKVERICAILHIVLIISIIIAYRHGEHIVYWGVGKMELISDPIIRNILLPYLEDAL